jgi:hypothetical protein
MAKKDSKKTLSDLLKEIIEKFAPGGEFEQTGYTDIMQEAKRLGAGLESQAIGRGLGNVTQGIPTLVNRQVASQKGALRRDTLSTYLSSLQNLTGLEQQERQFQQQLELSREQFGKQMTSQNTSRALDYIMSKNASRAAPQQDFFTQYMNAPLGASQKAVTSPTITSAPSAYWTGPTVASTTQQQIGQEDYPSLYAAGGYGRSYTTSAPSLF